MSDVAIGVGAAARKLLHRQVIEDHKAERRQARDNRLAWKVCGIAGLSAAVLMARSQIVVAVTYAPRDRFAVIDNYSGRIVRVVTSADAPEWFTEKVIRHYLSDYIEMRERWVWQLDSESFRRATAMSAMDEQTAYAQKRKDDDWGKRFGANGYRRITRWGDMTFRQKGKDRTLEYDFQFRVAEFVPNSGKVTERNYTARIIFQFHPDLQQTDQDATKNEAGLYVLHYHSRED